MSTSSKPKVAFYWCASCGGCEETVVDLAEDILGVVAAVDIVLWPVAMDFKYKGIEAMPDKSITATLLNGAIRSTEQEEMARLMRHKSQFLIAYGSCAVSGGIPSLANQFPREQILRFNYEDAPTLGNGGPKTRPQLKFAEVGREVSLPELHNVVRSLDQVVDVDYYIPGCPPTPHLTNAPLTDLLHGHRPSRRPPLPRSSKASCRPKVRSWRPTSPCATSARARSPSPPTSASPNSSARTNCWQTPSSASWRKASSAWDRQPAAAAAPNALQATCPVPRMFAPPLAR